MKFLEEQNFLVGIVEYSRVDRWCSVRKGRHPGVCIYLVLMPWIHADMYLSDWPHVNMVR